MRESRVPIKVKENRLSGSAGIGEARFEGQKGNHGITERPQDIFAREGMPN